MSWDFGSGNFGQERCPVEDERGRQCQCARGHEQHGTLHDFTPIELTILVYFVLPTGAVAALVYLVSMMK